MKKGGETIVGTTNLLPPGPFYHRKLATVLALRLSLWIWFLLQDTSLSLSLSFSSTLHHSLYPDDFSTLVSVHLLFNLSQKFRIYDFKLTTEN